MSGKESASKSLFSRLSNWGSGQNEQEDDAALVGASLEEMFAEDSSSEDEAMEPADPVPEPEPTPVVKAKSKSNAKPKARAKSSTPKAKKGASKTERPKKSPLSVSSKGVGKKAKKASPRSATDANGDYIIPGATLSKICYKVGSHRTAPAAKKVLSTFMHADIELYASVVYGLVKAQGHTTCGVKDLENATRLIALQNQRHILGDLNADVAPYVKVEKKQKSTTEEDADGEVAV